MRFNPTALIPFALVATRVVAHGTIIQVIANGKSYQGDNPNNPTGINTPIRTVDGNGPITDPATGNIVCGNKARVVPVDAPIDAGSELVLQWTPTWMHKQGPILTYMAECGGATCDKFTDPSQADWFKIDQAGVADVRNKDWEQGLVVAKGHPYNVTIPAGLKAGNYLVRHEIISLQGANANGGAEFYPQCIQVAVNSDGNLVPKPSDIIHFPGGYSASDPGVAFDPYNGNLAEYKFPGGPIAQLVPASGQASNGTSEPKESAGDQNTTVTTTQTTVNAQSETVISTTATDSTTVAATSPSAQATSTVPPARSSRMCAAHNRRRYSSARPGKHI